MRFGPWFPLARAVDLAPDGPGVLEIRAESLLPYPRGKSAMVLYDRSFEHESLRLFCAQRGSQVLKEAQDLGGTRIRFATTATPDVCGLRRLRDFVDRFGAPPGSFVR